MKVPNPNLLIFKVRGKLVSGGMEIYHSPDDINEKFDSLNDNKESLPLVKKLWELGDIKYTLVCRNSVHVEITEESSWENLRGPVRKTIEDYLKRKN